MLQRFGDRVTPASTVSVAIAIDGTSDRKLLSRICLASSGRKGRNSEASAMLIILPKLAEVVIETYFSVLTKVLRPSSTP